MKHGFQRLCKANEKSDVGERSHPSGGVDLGLSLRTQNHFLNALLVDMKAVGASYPLHVRVVDPLSCGICGPGKRFWRTSLDPLERADFYYLRTWPWILASIYL